MAAKKKAAKKPAKKKPAKKAAKKPAKAAKAAKKEPKKPVAKTPAAKPAAAAPPAPAAEPPRKRIPVALQLYSVRDDCAKDLEAVLRAVAEMGYDGVEFAGYHGRSAEELAALLNRYDLQVAGTHIGVQTLLGSEFDKTVAFNKAIGNKFLVVPGLPKEYTDTSDAWRRAADVFSWLAERTAALGMRVGYHNHSAEFQLLGGEMPWDTFFSRTNPQVVMQIDTGNALHGGADPVPFLERYPGRATTVHLKEFSAANDKALIGEGDVRWDDVFRLCETVAGTEWYIVEQESYAYPPLECVAKCREKLRGTGR